MLQPRAQPGQTDFALSRYQTRTAKRKSRSVRAPTGQMSTTLSELANKYSGNGVDICPVGEGPHRAEVHDVAGVLVGELRPREEPGLRVIAAVEDAELTRARDLVAKPHAARAEDAPLRVQHDVRAEGHRLRLVHLLVPHARVVEAVLHGVDL